MPVPPNTAPATATALTVDVFDVTVGADVQLAPNGTGFTTNCQPSNPQRQALWYRYTVPAGVSYIALGCRGVALSGNYTPVASLWTETAPGVYTQLKELRSDASLGYVNQYCGNINALTTEVGAFLVLVTPGLTVYLQVQNGSAGSPVTVDLEVLVTHAPAAAGQAGDLMISDDTGPYPAALLRDDGVIGYTGYGHDWAGEVFSVIQQGGWLLNAKAGTQAVNCFGPPPDFAFLSTIDLATWQVSTSGVTWAVSDQVSRHYVVTHQTGPSREYVHQIAAATGVKTGTWLLPTRLGSLLGVSPSGTVYYTDGTDLSTVRRFDTTTGAALADFLPDSGQYRAEGFVLPSGMVGIWTFDTTTWDLYDAAGTLVASVVRDYHRFALDNTLTGLWFWEGDQTHYSHALLSALDVNDQTMTIDAKILTSGGPTTGFGFSDCCPLMVYPQALASPPEPSLLVETRYIRRLRRAPHVANEHKRVFYRSFELDLERGQALATGQGSDPVVLLRISRDGGQTWGEEIRMAVGQMGDYQARVLARRLGHSRDTVFEIVVSDPIAWSIVDAFLDLEPGQH